MKLAISKALTFIYVSTGKYRAAIADFFVRPSTLIYLGISLILNGVSWFLAITLVRLLGDNLAILHYNTIFGIDRIGPPTLIYILPLLGFGFLALNFFLAAALRRKNERLPSTQLLIAGVAENVLLLIATYLIYAINFT